jgi:hypothetical protein
MHHDHITCIVFLSANLKEKMRSCMYNLFEIVAHLGMTYFDNPLYSHIILLTKAAYGLVNVISNYFYTSGALETLLLKRERCCITPSLNE